MRFAILCRVSTEGQEKEGVSLEVQQKTLSKCVETLGGQVVKEYVGAESAMGKKERIIFDELLADCSRDLFDAVMVFDLSRWSRDPEKSQYGFAILKKYGIKLFIKSTEHNLSDPETNLTLSILNSLNQFTVNQQTHKSMLSKIELARRGFPMTTGPFGRRLVDSDKSKPAIYEVIPEWKEKTERIYSLYVNEGLSTDKIAEIIGLLPSRIRKILFEYSSDTWTQKIHYDNRDEIITTKVPPLLTDEQILRAKAKAKTNKQFNSRKFNYLLGGRVKCGVCQMVYTGMSTEYKNKIRRYYSHSAHFRTEICIKSIQVPLIETAVIKAVADLFSSTKNLKMAIENAIGVSRDRKEILIKKIEECKKELNKLEKAKDKLVQLAIKGIFTEAEISKEMSKIRIDSIECGDQLKTFTEQLNLLMINVPDDLHLRIQRYYQRLCNSEGSILDFSFENQQKLLDWFFGYSKENGVFIMRNQPDRSIAFFIKGALGSSMIGLMAKDFAGSFIAGMDQLEHNFNNDNELVDFQRIIQDLDFVDENDASAR